MNRSNIAEGPKVEDVTGEESPKSVQEQFADFIFNKAFLALGVGCVGGGIYEGATGGDNALKFFGFAALALLPWVLDKTIKTTK
jgi:hypothetical protein